MVSDLISEEPVLSQDFTSVLRAASCDELRARVVSFATRLGFDTVSATTVVDHFGAESEFITMHNTPASYLAIFEDHGKGHRDPVMQHCRYQGVPIIWDQQTYAAAGQGEMWEMQAQFGYRTGIALAIHLPRGLHFFLGVDRDQALPTDSAELTRLTANLHLFAVHAQDAALRLLLPEAKPERDPPALTSRELECLRWTTEGKTSWEIGRILGISEHTVIRHVNNAAHKLGCATKHQAALKALRLKLIW